MHAHKRTRTYTYTSARVFIIMWEGKAVELTDRALKHFVLLYGSKDNPMKSTLEYGERESLMQNVSNERIT